MRTRREAEKCSYISALPERTQENDWGCFVNMLIAIVILGLVVLCSSGCSTCYVGLLRSEYNAEGKATGLYFGEGEYPSRYLATRVSATIEVPYWWWIGEGEGIDWYKVVLWPIGAPFALIDVPLSIVSDTIMLPYDVLREEGYRSMNKASEEEERTKKAVIDALEAESEEERSLGRPASPALPLVGSMNVTANGEGVREDE